MRSTRLNALATGTRISNANLGFSIKGYVQYDVWGNRGTVGCPLYFAQQLTDPTIIDMP